ncbi:LIM domain-binding protein 2 isoform X4 [Pseudomyrmex gracilis]|uniref:LIM domain-binding protein 2 isoform X4 n=1 Tax=Pseudomyrmex gracilis TaxID=219809 RepID=UPI0009950467|nr:LIM domain-binding protein 2 isoform X4 [Pseudomyrmex gracilis]XP_020287550.1 LIM domain-binding protein 2 isoform X4 [Pseudomyrmex gracilis]
MKANGTNNGCSRLNTPLAATTTLEDPGTPASWKGPPPGSEASPFTPNSVGQGGGPGSGPYNSTGGPPSNAAFQGPSPFPGSAGSPAGAPPYQGPPPGSATPQYTASPAPSGSSTPGPGPPPNSSGFPPPPNNSGPPYNGPGPSPFGSPSGAPPQFVGRPGSSGPPFVPPGAGNPHFPSHGQPFGGPQYGMPPGSPFGPGGHPMAGPMGPGHPAMMGPGGPVDRLDQGSLPVPRRHTPAYYNQPDYRLHELNKRLAQRTEESDNHWWESFANEFFEEDATLTLQFCLEDGPKRYSIGRTLIPRYFRSIFDGGVTELYYTLKNQKESFHTTTISLDCEQCTMVTQYVKPMFVKVLTEGRLILEFTFDDLMRIKSWHMTIRTYRELMPRSVVGMQQDPTMIEQLSKNITRQGMSNATLNYLRLCVILEPMQELMSRHKCYALSPRDCLKTTLFQKWQRIVAPPGKRESQRPASKRRKRKGSTSGPGNNAPPAPSKKRSPGPNFSLASQDVMVVGEPSLMGGEFGDEDERLITRLENTQYDAANNLDPHSHDTAGGPPPHPHQFHSEPTPGNSWPPDRGPGPPQGGPGSQVPIVKLEHPSEHGKT